MSLRKLFQYPVYSLGEDFFLYVDYSYSLGDLFKGCMGNLSCLYVLYLRLKLFDFKRKKTLAFLKHVVFVH